MKTDLPPDIAEIVARINDQIATPDHAERVRADAERTRRMFERDRTQDLSARGVPAKDIPRILAEQVEPTLAVRTVEAWLQQDRVWFLVLSGDPGSGKTVAGGIAVARGGGRLVHVTDLCGAKFDGERVAAYQAATLLVIDDLGVEALDEKGRDRALLDRILDARYAGRRRTLITTNLAEADLRARYGRRIARRLREVGRVVQLRAPEGRA